MYKYEVSTYEMAMKALSYGRRIIPDKHWFITNECGDLKYKWKVCHE